MPFGVSNILATDNYRLQKFVVRPIYYRNIAVLGLSYVDVAIRRIIGNIPWSWGYLVGIDCGHDCVCRAIDDRNSAWIEICHIQISICRIIDYPFRS